MHILCLKNVDNKGLQAINTKGCERQNETINARETKECVREYKGIRGAKQNKAAGKSLGLVRGTKESRTEDRKSRSKTKQKPLDKAWD